MPKVVGHLREKAHTWQGMEHGGIGRKEGEGQNRSDHHTSNTEIKVWHAAHTTSNQSGVWDQYKKTQGHTHCLGMLTIHHPQLQACRKPRKNVCLQHITIPKHSLPKAWSINPGLWGRHNGNNGKAQEASMPVYHHQPTTTCLSPQPTWPHSRTASRCSVYVCGVSA